MSGFVNATVAFSLWALMIPTALYAVWPWIKRVRIGLAPPDTELREAKEAQQRLFARFKEAHRELTFLKGANERARGKLREAEQERDALRAENEELTAQNERFGSQPANEELKKRALRWSGELFQFAQEREKHAPPEATPQMSGGFWDAIKESMADPKTQERANYDNETRRLYSEQYGGDVGAVLDALQRREWLDPEERKRLEEELANEFMSPTSSIRQVAQRLDAIGKRL